MDGPDDAITAVATEYFRSWFDGDAERMRSCLHPALSKRAPLEPGGPSLALDEDTSSSMVEHTGRGPRRQYEQWLDVTVLDSYEDIATVLVRSQPFVEYLHLARFDGRWLIVNALYVTR